MIRPPLTSLLWYYSIHISGHWPPLDIDGVVLVDPGGVGEGSLYF